MSLTVKRWYRSRRNQFIILVLFMLLVLYYIVLHNSEIREQDLNMTRRYIESRLQEALKEDKGMGCEIPKLDPFAKEVTQFDKDMPKIVCDGTDWVKCHMSECKVVEQILETTKNVECTYRDILYESDRKYTLGPPTVVPGDQIYTLTKSDHVKVKCTGKRVTDDTLSTTPILPTQWTGHSLGFRTTAKAPKPPPGREKSYNVLILGFDSTAKNGFIRRMPKSYEYLKDQLKAVILNGYNIVGDGTPAALFPILTGSTELELPEARKSMKNSGYLDEKTFIFHKLKLDGYRTAYFEDMPWIGTFQYRFNGFQTQPADHYLRAFYLEESSNGNKWWGKFGHNKYCVGDTPQYKVMLNITDQFFKLDGKRFSFTFIGDITHDDFNMISNSDDDVEQFLRDFQRQGHQKDTLLIVMGDHGARYANVRNTFQGKLEERLPLMALVLPEELQRERPGAREALASNTEALSTPHDVHATLLDLMGLTHLANAYRVKGADLPRAMTLLQPIPRNRSCSEAGIEPHWCACLRWTNVSRDEPLYKRAAEALLAHINSLTEFVRSLCAERTLLSIEWVMRQRANSRMLAFQGAKDADGYIGKFGKGLGVDKETFQLKIVVGPGKGIYEASMTYSKKEDKFHIDNSEISRINAYGWEPKCISERHPHLNMYCYCNG